MACLKCGSWFGHKHDLASFYLTEKSISSFTNSNCFIIRTMDLLFLYILGWSSEGLFLTIAKLFMCQFPGTASESFPLTVDPPAVNNGVLIHTHTHTCIHACIHTKKKSTGIIFYFQKHKTQVVFESTIFSQILLERSHYWWQTINI